MENMLEKKPTGLANKSDRGKDSADEKHNGNYKQKSASIKTINPVTNEVVNSFEEFGGTKRSGYGRELSELIKNLSV